MLSQYHRNKIWEHYRPGQEVDKEPTVGYLDAAQMSKEYIRMKEQSDD